MSHTGSIRFESRAIVTQRIEIIDDDIGIDDLVRGLESGDYVTSTDHCAGGGRSEIIDVSRDRMIGVVTCQQSEAENANFSVFGNA